MAGYGFGFSRGRRAKSNGSTGGPAPGPSESATIGAFTRNQFAAGIPVSASAIISGDAGGHWTVSAGRLYPSAAGDAADLNAGPYALEFSDGSSLDIVVEPDTWDVTDQSEWDFVARQSAAILAGKKIALRNSVPLTLGVTGSSGTPLRRVDLRDGSIPLTIKGRFGDQGDFANYCEVDKFQRLDRIRGLTIEHLKFTPVAETKIGLTGHGSGNVDDVTIDDCWISGEIGDPLGDYSTSSNYPNSNRDLITTAGSVAGTVGNVTVRNCKIEWGDSLINIAVNSPGGVATIEDNELSYFYGDGVAVTMGTNYGPPTIISGNFIHDSVGRASDNANPHIDAIRLQGQSTATVDWAGITIENNIILEGTARGDMQAIFVDDMKTSAADSGQYFTATIRNNIVAINEAVHGVTVVQAKDCLVENNTVVSFDQGSVSSTPSILIAHASVGTATNGGGNVARDNIADSIGAATGSLVTANQIAGRNGVAIDYATLFDGPNFDPASAEDAKLFFSTKVPVGASIA